VIQDGTRNDNGNSNGNGNGNGNDNDMYSDMASHNRQLIDNALYRTVP
jgi:hypothetical protein